MERQTINQLVKGALEELEKQRYARTSINNYKRMFNRFIRYADQKDGAFITEILSRSYLLDTYGWDIKNSISPSTYVTSQLRAIRILTSYEKSGSIPGRLFRGKEPPPCFKKHYDLYITECTSRGLSDATVDSRSADVCSLLLHAKNRNLASVAEIGQEFLDEYLHICSGKMPGAMARVISSVRCFLRSLFLNGVIQNDLSIFIPPASRYPTKPVQKLWTREEVTLLLNCMERSDSRGKRDYALILLILLMVIVS